MKRLGSCIALLLFMISAQAQLRLQSPDKAIEVVVQTGKQLTYAVHFKGRQLMPPAPLNLVVNKGDSLLTHARIKNTKRRSVNTTITSPIPEKRKIVPDVYNELRIAFNRPVSLIIRAYND